MSGSSSTVLCPKCGVENTLRGKAMTLALTCKGCKTYFCRGSWNDEQSTFRHTERPALTIGSRGKIDGYSYEVMGFVVKAESKYHYQWREYLLFNPYRGFAFLSEYNGHWNFIWPLERDPRNGKVDDFFYKDTIFKLYQKYGAEVIYAEGEFFFDVVGTTESSTNHEYVGPPYLIAVEKNDDSFIVFEGEHLTQNEIATAFALSKEDLPDKTGVGYTQPFNQSIDDNVLIKITVLFIVALVIAQIVLTSSSKDERVLQEQYYESNLKGQKMLVTPSFEFKDGTKSLEINLEAPIANDWFFGEFSLINEGDGTEYNFTHEIEYYSGYEDGEHWSEGSTSGTAFLSQIPAGKYHLNIYPEFSPNNHEFSISVYRDVPITSNFFIACIGLLLFPLIFFVWKRNYEQRRWSDSDYSPYNTE